MLYWYKSANTDAEAAELGYANATCAQVTGFTSTKSRLLALLVQKAPILTATAAELGYAEAMYFLGKAHAAGKYNLPGR